jgi:hypothetical protein
LYSVDGREIQVERPRTIRGHPGATKDELVQGEIDFTKRVIRIRRMRREQAWQVLFHEETHLTLDDLGVSNFLSPKIEEAICDAIAASRMAEMVRLLQYQQGED